MQLSSANRLRRAIHVPGLWLLVFLLAAITIPHYHGSFDQPEVLVRWGEALGLSRYDFERIFYLVPMVWAGFLFGRPGVLMTSLVALACMLPRALSFSPHPLDSLAQAAAIFVVGSLAGLSAALLQEERERHLQFAALYQVCAVFSQSLDLDRMLRSSIESIRDVLKVHAVMVFLTDDEGSSLILTAHEGVSPQMAESCQRLELGGSLNGVVARTGEPMYVEDIRKDGRLTNLAVRNSNLCSQIIVPLRCKGKVTGTLGVATRNLRRFRPSEVELLTALGNHMGVALDNARLYGQQLHLEENLHFYLHQITRAQEEERRRVARELHDDTIQALVVLSRQIDEIATHHEGLPLDSRTRLENLRQDTNSIVDGLRRLSQDLRPIILDRLGLLPALEWLASDVAKHSVAHVEVKVRGQERRLPGEVEMALFRIVQEALSNVARHSGATRAEVVVEFTPSTTTVVVRDNGKGFIRPHSLSDLPRDGKLGLVGIQERARLLGGTARVESKPGQGTTMRVETQV